MGEARILKRKHRRKLPRTGIQLKVVVDRGQQILDDPDGYFSEARVRAQQTMERDAKRFA